MKKYEQLQTKYTELYNETLLALSEITHGKKIDLREYDSFTDESGNEINGIEHQIVFGENPSDGEYIEYPISELKLTDALHLLSLIEL